MNSLTLCPQGSLIFRNLYGPANGPFEQEVASRAISYLFENIALHPDVRLKDLLSLFDSCPALHQVYASQWSMDVCKQAQLGAVPPKVLGNGEGVEYLQLGWHWNLDTYSNTYSNTQLLDLVGIGVKDGKQTSWSVSLTPVRELLELSLRFEPHLSIREDDIDAHAFGEEVANGQCQEMTLGQLIHSVLWELSFHGGAGEKEQVLTDLKAQLDEIDSGTAELIDGDDVFEELFGPNHQKSIAALFERVGDISAVTLNKVINSLEDDVLVFSALAREFGEEVSIKEPYRHLTARAFRRAFRSAYLENDG